MAIEQELVRELLSAIVKSKPDIQPGEHKWLIGMLKDMYNPKREMQHSDCIREINGLASCLFWGIVSEIKETYGVTIEASEAKTIIHKLVYNHGLQEDLSRWCIDTWCMVFDKNIDWYSVELISGSRFQANKHDGGINTSKFSEQIFHDIVVETLKKKPYDTNTKFELTVKARQLGLNDEMIQNIISNSKFKILEMKNSELEKTHKERQRLLEAKIQEKERENRRLKLDADKKRSKAIKHFNLGNLYLKSKHFTEAIREYTEAIQIDPSFADAHLNLGNVYYELKQYSLSINEYDQAIRINPLDFKSHHNLGNTYLIIKDYIQAIREYNEALSIDPNCKSTKTNLSYALKAKSMSE